MISSNIDPPERTVTLTLRPYTIRYRVPNPPANFQGREKEIASLAEMIQRYPIAIIRGESLVGKTALVQKTLAERFTEQIARSVVISVSADSRVFSILSELVMALGATQSSDGWQQISLDPSAQEGLLLDLAEQTNLWVVLEDFHNLHAKDAASLLLLLTRYARNSRWIITARSVLAPEELQPQVLTLEGTSATIATKQHEIPTEIFEQQVVTILGLLQRPLPAEVLNEIATREVASLVDKLATEGKVVVSPAGVALTEHSRKLHRQYFETIPEEKLVTVANKLAESHHTEAVIEGLRLHLSANQRERATEILQQRGEEIVNTPAVVSLQRVLRLYQITTHAKDQFVAEIVRWRVRCAVAIGDDEQTHGSLHEVLHQPHDQLALARMFFLKGKMQDAQRTAETTLKRDDVDQRVRFELSIVLTRTLSEQGKFPEALAVLQSLQVSTPNERARRDALMITKLIDNVDFYQAKALIEDLTARLPELTGQTRWEVIARIAHAEIIFGASKRAADAIKLLIATETDELFAMLHSRDALLILLSVSIQLGDLERSKRLIARFDQLRASAWVRSWVLLHLVEQKLLTGDFAGIDQNLAELSALGKERKDFKHFTVYLYVRLAIVRGDAALPASVIEGMESEGGITTWISGFFRTYLDIRRGVQGWTVPIFVPVFLLELLFVLSAVKQINALGYLVQGQNELALREIDEWYSAAIAKGATIEALGAMQIQLYALVIHGRSVDARGVAERLRLQSQQLGIPKVGMFGQLVLAMTDPEGPNIENVAKIAEQTDESGITEVTRCARALLEDRPMVDVIEKLFVSGLRKIAGWTRVVALDSAHGEPWKNTVVVDGVSLSVRREDGKAVTFAKSPLLLKLLLRVLGSPPQDQGVTKETLAKDVWELREYNPLRDDKRMQVAVRKLRTLIELNPSSPRIITTTADGYAMGTHVNVRVLS